MSKTRQTSVPPAAETLGEIRRRRQLSREGLADRAGVSLRTIERIEAGEVAPRRATRRVLASALDVEPTDIEFETAGDVA